MGFLGGTSGKQVDEFSKTLVDAVAKRYPPSLERAAEKKVSVTRVTKILEDCFDRAAQFTRERKLGVVNKARLGNSFKWGLTDLGYSKEFVEVATEGMIVYVTRQAPADAAAKSQKKS